MSSQHFAQNHQSVRHTSNLKNRPGFASGLSSDSGPPSTSYLNYPSFSSDLEEMLPFPYIPYQYISCEYRYDVKETPNSQQQPNQQPSLPTTTTAQSFHPYYVSPIPALIPNFTELPPAIPSFPVAPNLVASTTSTSGEELFEPVPFGPGPPIVTGERLKGPRGCNLFVFHLPNEITNWDLYLLFRRHGTILSVHIMVNKTTGLSKGYGFVSFANPEDARVAIETMDGFRLGKKRLKVQLKRIQDDNDEEDGEQKHSNPGHDDRVNDFMIKHADSYENRNEDHDDKVTSRTASLSEDEEVRRGNSSGCSPNMKADENARSPPECGNEEKVEAVPRGETIKTSVPPSLMKLPAVQVQQIVRKTA
jgi:hypothetical protein